MLGFAQHNCYFKYSFFVYCTYYTYYIPDWGVVVFFNLITFPERCFLLLWIQRNTCNYRLSVYTQDMLHNLLFTCIYSVYVYIQYFMYYVCHSCTYTYATRIIHPEIYKDNTASMYLVYIPVVSHYGYVLSQKTCSI